MEKKITTQIIKKIIYMAKENQLEKYIRLIKALFVCEEEILLS